jgi:hypothetical protein
MSSKNERNERLKALMADADEVNAQRRIIRKFSEEEIRAMREQATETMLKIQIHNEHLKEYKAENLKPLQEELGKVLARLRIGSHDENMVVQGIINKELGRMEYFDEEGEKVDERPLTREEMNQLDFRPGSSAGSSN